MDKINFLNTIQLDILREIGNIGAGNAATALSELLNKKIEMNVPRVQVVSFDEMMELVGGPDEVVAAVFLQIDGDLTGNMFFLLPVKKATIFIQQLTGMMDFSFDNPSIPEIALSAFQEMGNILAGSYLSALSDFLQMKLLPSVPAVGIDMFGAIISFGLIEISQVSDYAIVIDTEVKDPYTKNDTETFKGHFFLLPDPDSFAKLFKKLGVEVE
ncbi:chemotaxis protein CheC [Bacillus andreraoultii]|uniref:chemotaxis protein CheC n=1 Tax=Bacillus andreraoultii TaxID=1499685 RepID=UPI000539C5D4|nr:chemotaxis protein CheC [Bacillus andreraoultii]